MRKREAAGKLRCVGKCHRRMQAQQIHRSLLKEGWIFLWVFFLFSFFRWFVVFFFFKTAMIARQVWYSFGGWGLSSWEAKSIFQSPHHRTWLIKFLSPLHMLSVHSDETLCMGNLLSNAWTRTVSGKEAAWIAACCCAASCQTAWLVGLP